MGLVVVRLLALLSLVVLGIPMTSYADAAGASPGRRAFEEGVEAASRSAWREAADAFEASLREADRPATRFNLVLVYAELGDPLAVARHALAFLRVPRRPSRAEAHTRVQRALDEAVSALSILTTETLPDTAALRVDGETPAVRDAERRVYVVPGLHELTAEVGNAPAERITLHLAAGQTVSWPRSPPPARALEAPTSAPPPVDQHAVPVAVSDRGPAARPPREEAPPLPRLRRALAWTLGGGGGLTAAAALTMYGMTVQRARVLRDRDPFQSGFLSAGERYQTTRGLVSPLALATSVAVAAAVAVGPSTSCWRHRSVAWSAIIASSGLFAAGGFLMIRTPDTLGESRLETHTREAGSLLLGAALPLLTAGLKYVWQSRASAPGERCPARLAPVAGGPMR